MWILFLPTNRQHNKFINVFYYKLLVHTEHRRTRWKCYLIILCQSKMYKLLKVITDIRWNILLILHFVPWIQVVKTKYSFQMNTHINLLSHPIYRDKNSASSSILKVHIYIWNYFYPHTHTSKQTNERENKSKKNDIENARSVR